jgi:hypothetical protein
MRTFVAVALGSAALLDGTFWKGHAPANNQAPTIKKLSPIMWEEHVPLVGCECGSARTKEEYPLATLEEVQRGW